jgi:hypothetical protein
MKKMAGITAALLAIASGYVSAGVVLDARSGTQHNVLSDVLRFAAAPGGIVVASSILMWLLLVETRSVSRLRAEAPILMKS